MRRLALATIFIALMGVSEASACDVVRFRFNLGTDTSAVMHVRSGKRCSIIVHAGTRSAFSGVAISTPPRNGTAQARSSGATYQSRPGYKGEDAFAFTVTGTGAFTNGSTAKTTIRVSVTAQ